MKKAGRSLPSLLAAAVLLIGIPISASAAPITFIFDGSVTVVNPLLTGTFHTGDVLTGSLTYDSALIDSNAAANLGAYAPISSLMFTIGSYSATYVNGTGYVNVNDGLYSDQLSIRGDVTGPKVNYFSPFNLQFGFSGGGGSTFTSDALPLAFDSSDFTFTQFYFTFTNRSNPYDITSGGTNFTGVQGTFSGSAGGVNQVTPVPEPATMTLFASGLAAIPWLRRKRREWL